MKKLLSLLICGLLLGCSPSNYDDSSLWDSVNSLENRLATLEVLMKAVDKNLYILSVKPTENGYVITFSDNSQITILNGKDGADGDDGDDGKSGIIKVTQDDDNVYFKLSDGSVITIPKNGRAPGSDEAILFEDTIAHDICVNLWDTNNDGQLSYAEAAAVKSIGMVFKGKEIVNFKEFQYFTGVTAIEASAFYGCRKLTKIGIPKNIQSIGYDAFGGCDIGSIYISDLKAWCKIKWNWNNRTGIHTHDLYLDNELITDIVIPDGITEIGDYTFDSCNLTSVTIPNSVTSIGKYAFSDTSVSSLKSIYISDLDAWCKIKRNGNSGYYSYNLYLNNQRVTDVTIPDDMTEIGDYTFYGCKSLKNVTIPNGVTSIRDYAFSGCSSLTSITIPDGVTSIGAYAFAYCSGLTSVTIPNGVTSIGEWTFSSCTNLTSVTIPNGVTSIGEWTFSSCTNLTSVTIPNSVTSIGTCAFSGCNNLTSVTIPNSVTSIGCSAFRPCDKLTSVYCKPTWPPKLNFDQDEWRPFPCPVYVPTTAVSRYNTTLGWEYLTVVGYDFD